jgi:pimeloyl-ACP methyl ester carboxylesterase
MMKKWLRWMLVGLLVLLVAVMLTPFIIPISETGIDPKMLVNDPDGAFITIQNVAIYYEDKGDNTSPVVILVHGLFGSTETWRYNADVLADAGYRVIAFDRPGFGLSDKPDSFNYSVSNQADLTAELMDALNIDTAIMVGHSAGANVLGHFAIRHPERITKLVLVDAALLTGGPPPFVGALLRFPPIWRWGRVILQRVFTREQLENSLASFYVNASFLTSADYDAYWRAFQTPNWDIGLLGLTRDSAGNTLSREAIATIQADTVLIWGDQDTVTPIADGKALTSLIPNSRLMIITNTGHQPFEEAPDEFNRILLSILDA